MIQHSGGVDASSLIPYSPIRPLSLAWLLVASSSVLVLWFSSVSFRFVSFLRVSLVSGGLALSVDRSTIKSSTVNTTNSRLPNLKGPTSFQTNQIKSTWTLHSSIQLGVVRYMFIRSISHQSDQTSSTSIISSADSSRSLGLGFSPSPICCPTIQVSPTISNATSTKLWNQAAW